MSRRCAAHTVCTDSIKSISKEHKNTTFSQFKSYLRHSVLGKDTLQHFPLLGGFRKKIFLYISLNKN